MNRFIIEDNNNLKSHTGIMWVPGVSRLMMTRRQWLTVEGFQALSHKGLSQVAQSVKVALSPEKAGDPGVSFSYHGLLARGERQIFGFALHRQQGDHCTDQSPVRAERAADEIRL